MNIDIVLNVSLFQGLPQIFKPSLRGHSLLQFVHQGFSLDNKYTIKILLKDYYEQHMTNKTVAFTQDPLTLNKKWQAL